MMSMSTVVRWGVVGIFVACILKWVAEGLSSDEELPFSLLNSWMAVPIVAVTVIPIIFSMTSGSSRSRFAGAPLAIGTLVETRRTGLTVNDQPQLDIVFDVETMDGQTFRGTARQIVDQTEIGMLTPGTTLPVRYRPDRMDGKIALAVDASEDEVEALMYTTQLAKGKMTARQVQIAQHGIDAQAVIMEMRPTGEVRNGEAVIDLLLRVTRPDGSTYETRVEKALAPVAIPGVQPGMVVRARYLPDDESDVGIEVRYA